MYSVLRNLNWASISSWDDLEKVIIALPHQQARGEAFEEFCHAYFSIQKDLYQARQVWRYADVPTDLLNKKLGSSSHQDEGIDGILLHYDGTVTAYQAKFRTDRNDIPSQRELSTFYMVSDRADSPSRKGEKSTWPDSSRKFARIRAGILQTNS
jgi:predicted helicase